MAAMKRSTASGERDENLKLNKKKKSTEEAVSTGAEELISSLQRISTCFGIGGFYSSVKNRNIESKKEKLDMLSKGWINSDVINTLPSLLQNRYIEVMSERTLQLLALLKKIIRFYDTLHGKDKKQFKDVAMDMLMKDLKLDPSLQVSQRYTQMRLWNEVMKVNQEAFRSFDKFVNDQPETDGTVQIEDTHPLNTAEAGDKEVKDDSEKGKSFRDFYMGIVTSSFADDLDRLREQSNLDGKQVGLLIDCLEAGKDIWSDVEKDLLQSSFVT